MYPNENIDLDISTRKKNLQKYPERGLLELDNTITL